MRRSLGFFLMTFALSPRNALAESASVPVELDWDAPGECPGVGYVTAEIERILSTSTARAARMRA